LFGEVESVILARAIDVLVAHHFDSLLLGLQFTLKDVQFYSVLLERDFVLLQTYTQFSQLVPDSFLVDFEETNLLRVKLIEFILLFVLENSSIELLLLDIESI
jgi:hypothetical protein